MANITVSPTRMELTRLKGKLRTAQRGHKLLKDKRDELMKQFLDTVREVRALRAEVEEELMTVHGAFTVASALMSSEALEQALVYPKQSVELTMSFQNIMSVNVPVYDFQTQTWADSDIYPYGFAATSGELDTAVDALGKVFRKMLKLAEIEKSAQLMAEEIEKTRRRVNALEYVMIPNTQEAIRYINMKLDENDRATTIRLMKVKDMILKESLEEKRAETAKAVKASQEENRAEAAKAEKASPEEKPAETAEAVKAAPEEKRPETAKAVKAAPKEKRPETAKAEKTPPKEKRPETAKAEKAAPKEKRPEAAKTGKTSPKEKRSETAKTEKKPRPRKKEPDKD